MLFRLIFTQPGFSLHTMFFMRFLWNFLDWGGVGVKREGTIDVLLELSVEG